MLRRAALALLVVLSGCSFAAQETPTLTPVAVPESSPTPPPSSTATPAETAERGARLVRRHRESLSGRPFRMHRNHTVRFANGTVWTRTNATVTVGADPSRYVFRLVVTGRRGVLYGAATGEFERYANGSAVVERVVTSDERVVRVARRRYGEPISPARAYHGEPFDAGVDLLRRARDRYVTYVGPERYRIVAREFAGDTFTTPVGRVRNLTVVAFVALVGPSGRVESRRLVYRGTLDGHRVYGVYHVEYEAVGTATVERPAWVANATEQSIAGAP